MELPVDLLSKLDITNLLAIAAMLWFFNSRLDKKFEKIDEKFDQIDKKFEKIDLEFKEIRTSLNRMEGAFYAKDCCILKDDKPKQKVE